MSATTVTKRAEALPTLRVRRSFQLWFGLHESVLLDASDLLRGGMGLKAIACWQAWVPAQQRRVDLNDDDLPVLRALSEDYWTDLSNLVPALIDRIPALLEVGVLISASPVGSTQGLFAATDQRLREGHWHPLSALVHAFGRWEGQHHGEDGHLNRYASLSDMVAAVGPPPAAHVARCGPSESLALPCPDSSPLDRIASRRRTVRNWDLGLALPLATLSEVLWSSFAARGSEIAAPQTLVYKKQVPSGGALHPVDAYLLVQRVESLKSGLYHYDPQAHALEPMPCAEDLGSLASSFVAGQLWFAGVHVQLVLVARFRRNFWKYRSHAKAYRAVILDSGHLSMMVYLRATELNAGAFITAAINEIDIENALGLDPLEASPLAVCGIGIPAVERTTREFDPLRKSP